MLLQKAMLADRAAPQAEWRMIHRLADSVQPAVRRKLRNALLLTERETNWARVRRYLEEGKVNEAVEAVNVEAAAEAMLRQVWPLIQQTFDRAGKLTARNAKRRGILSKAAKPKPLRATDVVFNQTNPHATNWAAESSATLVTNISDGTRTAIRQVVTESFQNQVTPQETSRRMRRIAGLGPTGAASVERTRQRLDAIRPRLSHAVLTRRLEFAAGRALRDRTNLITRTEIMAASNGGQLEAWRQGRSSGFIDESLVKEFIVTPDFRLCPVCSPLDGEQTGVEEAFSFGGSNPPVHPRCRCAMGLMPPRARRTLQPIKALPPPEALISWCSPGRRLIKGRCRPEDDPNLPAWAKSKGANNPTFDSKDDALAYIKQLDDEVIPNPNRIWDGAEIPSSFDGGIEIGVNPKVKAVLQEIPIDSLYHGIQGTVSTTRVAHHLAKKKRSPIKVVKNNGKYMIQDGHHRAEAARMLGEKTIKAKVFEPRDAARSF